MVGKKCIGCAKIGRGTGKQQADVCLTTLTEWNIRQQIRGMVFDTTASNTGLKNGTCTLIENSLGIELAWLTCMHHIMFFVHCSGLQEDQTLHSSKGFRLGGSKSTTRRT